MDHSEAVGIQAVEKYLLDELSSSQKETFEEHFFSCNQCAEEVRAGAVFTENLRSVARDAAHPPFEKPNVLAAEGNTSWGARFREMAWRPFLIPSFAAAAFCAVAAVETFVVIPGLRSELASYQRLQSVEPFVLRAASRGDEATKTLPWNVRFFTIYFDITWQRSNAGYICQILDASNHVVEETKVANPETGDGISLLLNSSRFVSGKYTVLVHDVSRPAVELGRYEFNLERK